MTPAEQRTSETAAKTTSAGKILAGAIYILTFLHVLAFIWQSFADFL